MGGGRVCGGQSNAHVRKSRGGGGGPALTAALPQAPLPAHPTLTPRLPCGMGCGCVPVGTPECAEEAVEASLYETLVKAVRRRTKELTPVFERYCSLGDVTNGTAYVRLLCSDFHSPSFFSSVAAWQPRVPVAVEWWWGGGVAEVVTPLLCTRAGVPWALSVVMQRCLRRLTPLTVFCSGRNAVWDRARTGGVPPRGWGLPGLDGWVGSSLAHTAPALRGPVLFHARQCVGAGVEPAHAAGAARHGVCGLCGRAARAGPVS